jgi:beta-fructofuranosidase
VRWEIGHAVSADLIHWEDQGVILSPGEAGQWDGECLATGSVIEQDGTYWMAYTGNYAGPIPGVGLAVSRDLDHWKKIDSNPILLADGKIYSNHPNAAWGKPRWRDPFLYAEDGVVHVFITAATSENPAVGVVAHGTTTDMRNWDLQPPLDTPPIATDLECPKLHRIDDMYCLTVSLQDCIALPTLRERQPDNKVVSSAYCLTSSTLQGPYTLTDTGRVLTGDFHPYACEPVLFRGEYFLLGTVWDDSRGDSVCDPLPLRLWVCSHATSAITPARSGTPTGPEKNDASGVQFKCQNF